jgi:hypothetical protein
LNRRSIRSRLQIVCWMPLYLWVGPWTVVGLSILLIPRLGRRNIRFHRGTIGIFGPGVAKLMNLAPVEGGAIAMAFGHTILAKDERAWLSTFRHELIHVRQYQWFGPFFVPAYFFESFWQWCRGRHPYLDNRFEVQARKYETTI